MLSIRSALACALLSMSAMVHAQGVAARPLALLAGTLVCEGNPLTTIRAMTKSEANSSALGYLSLTLGEEMDEKNVIVLLNPMRLAGAHTSGVVLSLTSVYSDFNGVVFAEFEGNYLDVIKQLNLKLAPASGKAAVIGKYQRSLGVDLDGKPDNTCPKTIALTPLRDKGKFVLGCGWCNG